MKLILQSHASYKMVKNDFIWTWHDMIVGLGARWNLDPIHEEQRSWWLGYEIIYHTSSALFSFSCFLCRVSQSQQLSLCRLQWAQVLLPPMRSCTRSSTRVSVQMHLSFSDTHAQSSSQPLTKLADIFMMFLDLFPFQREWRKTLLECAMA